MTEKPDPRTRILAAALAISAVATLLALIISAVAASSGDNNPIHNVNTAFSAPGISAVVNHVHSGPCDQAPPGAQCASLNVTATLSNGKKITYETTEGPGTPVVKTGDHILVAELTGQSQSPGGDQAWVFVGFDHRSGIWSLFLLAIFAVLAIGRRRGVGALVGVAITFVIILGYCVPTILHGANPVVVAVISGSAITMTVLFVAHGMRRATATAVLSTLIGLVVSALLGTYAAHVARLTGLSSDDAVSLHAAYPAASISGILIAGFTLGILGAMNDVTVSQSSVVSELSSAGLSAGEVFTRAMRIGQDHYASSIYTLLQVYLGAAITTVLVAKTAHAPLAAIISNDVVAEEVTRALVGIIVIGCMVPIGTALSVALTPMSSQTQVRPDASE